MGIFWGKPPKLIAMFDYDPEDTDKFLPFKEEQIITIIQTKDDEWYKGSYIDNAGKKLTGMVPSNFVCEPGSLDAQKWYFPDMSRNMADSVLNSLKPGSFLVRPPMHQSKNNQNHVFTLSYKNDHEIIHCRIFRNFKGRLHIDRHIFPTLIELIHFYKNNEGKIRLVLPCPKKKPVMRNTLDHLVVDRSRVKIKECIGTGNFGTVNKGRLNNRLVAVKSCKPEGAMNLDAIQKEYEIMMKFSHPHVIALHGVCLGEPVLIITEYMVHGALLDYLRGGNTCTPDEMVNFAIQITEGMLYLERIPILHRDLAARNILLGGNFECKVADFGMARKGTHYTTRSGKFPLEWTAIEAFQFGAYSIKSDVWSLGIVLFEIVTHGGFPYRNIPRDELCEYIIRGGRIKKPSECPDEFYKIMKSCWVEIPEGRPNFATIKEALIKYLDVLEYKYSE